VLVLQVDQRELVDQLIAGGAVADMALLPADEETREHFLDEGYDSAEIDEAFRRVQWLRTYRK
jgi:hypothetical protein